MDIVGAERSLWVQEIPMWVLALAAMGAHQPLLVLQHPQLNTILHQCAQHLTLTPDEPKIASRGTPS